MHRNKLFISLFLLILLVSLQKTSLVFANDQSPKVCVLNFKNLSSSQGMGMEAADFITADLLKINTFQVIDRTHLKEVLQEQSLEATGVVESSTAVRIGKLLGVNYIVTGTVNGTTIVTPGHYQNTKKGSYWVSESYSSSATLSVSMINVETGQVVSSSQTDASEPALSDALSGAIYDAVRNIYTFMPLQGYVIKVEGNRYYIDLGKNKNVSLNDKFIVTQEGETIIHPKTGKLLHQKRNAGLLEIVEIMDDMAVAVKVSDKTNGNTSTSIASGDMVTRILKDKPGRFLGLIGSREHIY